jgi:short-subunit dehydrogenase
MRVLVTGGSSGIGLACARRLTAGGHRLVLLARGEEALARAAQALEPAPAVIAADVGDAIAIHDAVDRAAALLGGLDAVVADAGAGVYGPFADSAPEDYERTIRTTLLGVLHTAHAALPHLEKCAGTLVVVGSIAGRVPTPWLAGYTAAKHGVRGFVRSLHAELRARRSPVRVALIAPGPVDTPFWQRARTTDRRLPPRLGGVYRADDVAREIERALERPRPERSVGGLMGIWAYADALAPTLSLAATGRIARLGWRNRDARPVSHDDAFSQPAREPHEEGGLPARPSVARTLRDLVGGSRR